MLSVASWDCPGLFGFSSPTSMLIYLYSLVLGHNLTHQFLFLLMSNDLIQNYLEKKAIMIMDYRSSLSNRILHITLTGSNFSASESPKGKLLGNKGSIWFRFSSCCCQCSCQLGHRCRWPHYIEPTVCCLCVCARLCVTAPVLKCMHTWCWGGTDEGRPLQIKMSPQILSMGKSQGGEFKHVLELVSSPTELTSCFLDPVQEVLFGFL